MPFTHPLDSVYVASPCSADWNAMRGDERRRFCGDCGKHVYNLSAMTRAEAESFVEAAEGSKCIRFYRRADGTLLTAECPVGAPAEAPPGRTSVRFAGLFGLLAGAAALVKLGTSAPAKPSCSLATTPPAPGHAVMGSPPPRAFMGDFAVAEPKMGKIAMPPKAP